jgi:hypothetical protein
MPLFRTRSSSDATLRRRAALLVALAAGAFAARPAAAQAYGYPSFQPPAVVGREYNFGAAGVGNLGGTALVFQWREGTSAKNQLSFDGGFASPDLGGGMLFVGGQFAHQLTTATADMPFDMLFTVGVGGSFSGDVTTFRVPVGLSVGHRFPLDRGMSITPYVHPRIAIGSANFSNGVCDGCRYRDNNNVGINFDIGGNFQINPQFAVRASAGFGGNQLFGGDSFGVSVAWTPPGLGRR